MKAIKFAQKIVDAIGKYQEKYPEVKEPEIFSFDSDEGMLICAKVEKSHGGSLRKAKKPYMYVKTGLERFL